MTALDYAKICGGVFAAGLILSVIFQVLVMHRMSKTMEMPTLTMAAASLCGVFSTLGFLGGVVSLAFHFFG